MTSPAGPHTFVNPPGLSPAVGFSHVALPAPGQWLVLGGQTAQLPDGTVPDVGLVEQFGIALDNLVAALAAVDALPEHIVSMTVYTTRGAEYRDRLSDLGREYRQRLGRHYPAMAFFEIAGLFDPLAKIELVCLAVRP